MVVMDVVAIFGFLFLVLFPLSVICFTFYLLVKRWRASRGKSKLFVSWYIALILVECFCAMLMYTRNYKVIFVQDVPCVTQDMQAYNACLTTNTGSVLECLDKVFDKHSWDDLRDVEQDKIGSKIYSLCRDSISDRCKKLEKVTGYVRPREFSIAIPSFAGPRYGPEFYHLFVRTPWEDDPHFWYYKATKYYCPAGQKTMKVYQWDSAMKAPGSKRWRHTKGQLQSFTQMIGFSLFIFVSSLFSLAGLIFILEKAIAYSRKNKDNQTTDKEE